MPPANSTIPEARRHLSQGETASGEITAGPNEYWKVYLDQARMEWKGDLIQLTGEETRIEVQGESVKDCVEGFMDAFICLERSLRTGAFKPDWVPAKHHVFYAETMHLRLGKMLATPPSDGDPYTVYGDFWDGECPHKNVKRWRLVYPAF